MSLRHTSGTSLVEVMVMMVILGISIVGIYGMVDSGKRLASLTDTRLNAVNIAREGLESVTTLRDSFALSGYESWTCSVGGSSYFFSTDGNILLDLPYNCPTPSTTPPPASETPYILKDDKVLENETASNFIVCTNEFGWYSQEYAVKTAPTTPCTSTVPFCTANTTQSCQTKFQRKITFRDCAPSNSAYCMEVISKVWWWDTASDSLELSQIMTSLD